MFKLFELHVRMPGLGKDEFLEQLTAAAAALDGVSTCRGYTVQEALPLPARKDIVQLDVPSEVDAFVEVWTDNPARHARALTGTEGEAWRRARAALSEQARTLVLEEHPLISVPEPRPAARNNAFLTRHPDLTREAFLHEWLDAHGEMCRGIPYLRAFVPCVVVDEVPETDIGHLKGGEIHGIAQAWFDSQEEEFAMIQTPEAKEWFAHGAVTFGLIKAFGARETLARVPQGA